MYKCYTYTKQNSLGLLKKGTAKQGRIKRRIIWHLRWLVSTRADINLLPSESLRPKTDIKWQPSAMVRTGTDIKSVVPNWIDKIIQGLIQEQTMHENLFKLSFGHLKFQQTIQKSSQVTI